MQFECHKLKLLLQWNQTYFIIILCTTSFILSMNHWGSCSSIVKKNQLCYSDSSWKKNTVQLINVERVNVCIWIVNVCKCAFMMSVWLYLESVGYNWNIQFVSFFWVEIIQWNSVINIFQARLIVCLSRLVTKMTVSKVLWNGLWFECANDVRMKPSKSYMRIDINAPN